MLLSLFNDNDGISETSTCDPLGTRRRIRGSWPADRRPAGSASNSEIVAGLVDGPTKQDKESKQDRCEDQHKRVREDGKHHQSNCTRPDYRHENGRTALLETIEAWPSLSREEQPKCHHEQYRRERSEQDYDAQMINR